VFTVFTPSHRGGRGSPLVALHGFTDTWRTWELVLPALERRHDVFAPTLPGHAGGPPLDPDVTTGRVLDAVERVLDEAGIGTAHLVGNSLGGYVALHLAARGRADSVVALAPAGGWIPGDPAFTELLRSYTRLQEQARAAAPHAKALLATRAGRRRVTEPLVVRFEHIPVDLLAHQMLGMASCRAVGPLAENALREGYALDAARIACPVRIVWGTEDRLLPWPAAATRYRREWLPQADWVELEEVGHAPQLDVPLETAQLILGVTGG
jgi:pimeloyl-ACP methyl ester carboxylesterase